MTFEQLRIAVESRMAQWTDAPIAFDGVPVPGPDEDGNLSPLALAQKEKQPWVRLTIVPGDTLTVAIGSGPKARHTGLIALQIFTAERIGSAEAMRLADSLASHIQYWQQGKFSTQAASLARIGPSGGWHQVNLTVPYRAD